MWSLGKKARTMSHGQSQRMLFDGLLAADAVKDSVILIDEPEQGLDLDGIVYLRDLLRDAKAQFIIATHCPFLVLDPRFNVVEMHLGYLDRMRAEYGVLLGSVSRRS